MRQMREEFEPRAPTGIAQDGRRLMQAAGMYGLLSEVLASGVLFNRYGSDADLRERIQRAVSDYEGLLACSHCGSHVEHNCAGKRCPVGVSGESAPSPVQQGEVK
jgi:hypothetical protein